MSNGGRTGENAATELAAFGSDGITAYQALLKARIEIGHTVAKNATNPHFRSGYADLEAVMAAVEPVLHGNGLILFQTVDGEALLSRLIHADTGFSIDCGSYPLICAKPNDPQALGSAMTYARRYTVMAIMGLAPADDDGERASGRGGVKEAPAMPKAKAPTPSEGGDSPDAITEGKRKRLFAIASAAGWGVEEMKDELKRVFHYESSKDIPWKGDTYDNICAHFEAGPAFPGDDLDA